MKTLLGIVLLLAIGVGIYLKYPAAAPKQQSGVHIGATVEEVEKTLGPPLRVLPSFGPLDLSPIVAILMLTVVYRVVLIAIGVAN